MLSTVNILEGNTFVVSDRRGDIDGTPVEPHGLFAADTRYLSRWILTIDGARPASLSVDETHYYQAQFFLAPGTGTSYIDAVLSVFRRRTVRDGFRERIEVINSGAEPAHVELTLTADADFADLFEVKDATAGEKVGDKTVRVERDRLVFRYERDTWVKETWVVPLGGSPDITETGLRYTIEIAPQQRWKVDVEVLPVGDIEAPPATEDWDDPRGRRGYRSWVEPPPELHSDWRPLEQAYARTLHDLAALRFSLQTRAQAELPAAGLPWFMTLFGRDSSITSLQALPFLPELAEATLRTLADFQARTSDDFRDADPGKLPHELRFGELTAFEERPHSPYYGTADATMLWLVLLDEYVEWTGHIHLARQLEPAARAALAWIDRYGDRDGDGYVEYERRNTETGLENQCWKDSWNSIQSADGTLASFPRATCELQGYTFDAKRRCARLAREIWGDADLADRLDREATELRDRFNRDFWIDGGEYYALALDGAKQPVDALSSNIGHLLWSGIVPEERAATIAGHLLGERLFSGWGIRTFATDQAGYNPIGYHLGTVWPHDTAIAVLGLTRYGFRTEAAQLAMALLDAAEQFGGRLPEAFGGYPRHLTRFPVEYPTACSPQAWASGAPLMLVRAVLGLEVDGDALRSDPVLPDRIRTLELRDIPGRWGRSSAGVAASDPYLVSLDRAGALSDRIGAVFARLAERFDAEAAAGLHATMRIDIIDVGSWRLVVEHRELRAAPSNDEADCALRTDLGTLTEILEGHRHLATAVLSGKVHVTGNREVAMTIAQLLAPPDAA